MQPERRKMIRKLIAALSALIVVCGVVAAAQPSQASAFKCGNGSCLDVRGTKLFVEYVRPHVSVPALVKYYGHSEIWGPGVHFDTPDRWFQNASATAPSTQASWMNYYLNRSFPDQSKICVRFWRKNVPYNSYSSFGNLCATVHR